MRLYACYHKTPVIHNSYNGASRTSRRLPVDNNIKYTDFCLISGLNIFFFLMVYLQGSLRITGSEPVAMAGPFLHGIATWIWVIFAASCVLAEVKGKFR